MPRHHPGVPPSAEPGQCRPQAVGPVLIGPLSIGAAPAAGCPRPLAPGPGCSTRRRLFPLPEEPAATRLRTIRRHRAASGGAPAGAPPRCCACGLGAPWLVLVAGGERHNGGQSAEFHQAPKPADVPAPEPETEPWPPPRTNLPAKPTGADTRKHHRACGRCGCPCRNCGVAAGEPPARGHRSGGRQCPGRGPDQLNLAAVLEDGQKVLVPRQGETAPCRAAPRVTRAPGEARGPDGSVLRGGKDQPEHGRRRGTGNPPAGGSGARAADCGLARAARRLPAG